MLVRMFKMIQNVAITPGIHRIGCNSTANDAHAV